MSKTVRVYVVKRVYSQGNFTIEKAFFSKEKADYFLKLKNETNYSDLVRFKLEIVEVAE